LERVEGAVQELVGRGVASGGEFCLDAGFRGGVTPGREMGSRCGRRAAESATQESAAVMPISSFAGEGAGCRAPRRVEDGWSNQKPCFSRYI
jgi:hypothetical protein